MPQSRAAIGNVSQSRDLTEMAMGYSRSRILCAAARLGVADALGDEERSAGDIAQMCGAQPSSMYRLLRALASFGVVVERAPEHFVLTPFGQPLRKDAPNSEWAAIVFWADLLADSWSYMTECIRTGENAGRIMEREGVASRWSKDPNARAIFGAVMGTAPAEDYMPIARAWDFSQYRVVADLGGGGGALIAAVLEAYPNVHGMLVDREEAIDRARPRFESAELAAWCTLVAADLCNSIPAGADVYMMKHVLHGYDDARAVEILRHCRSVLPAEGRLLVIEFVLPDVVDHADPELEHRLMSDLNMLAVTGGKERSAAEWKKLLHSAGFECEGIIPVPGELVSIVEAAPLCADAAA
jgi:ubiquinone/menaquinone biosynthesis C-methylase UbiE